MVELAAGEVVYVRHFQGDVISAVYSTRAVRHDADGLLLWIAQGSRHWFPYMPDGREMRETPLPEWAAARKVWTAYTAPNAMLSWHAPGVDFAAQWFFRGGAFTHWYANLEQPGTAWRDGALAGLDTVDWDLDVWIGLDRQCHWKDEEDLAARRQWPELYWVTDPDRARRAGEAAIALAEAGAFPFDGTWCDFQPDLAWGPVVEPALPTGWDRSRAF
jgi:hypothetical protein